MVGHLFGRRPNLLAHDRNGRYSSGSGSGCLPSRLLAITALLIGFFLSAVYLGNDTRSNIFDVIISSTDFKKNEGDGNNEGNNSSNSSLSLYDGWNTTAYRLCPNKVPQNMSDLGPKLFHLARLELGGNSSFNWCPNSPSLNKQDLMSRVFYNWWWGDVNFIFNKHENNSMFFSYLPIWKCANDGLHSYFNSLRENNNQGGKASKQLHLLDQTASRDNYQHCIVTNIRDPISHFLSGYNEVEWRIKKFPQYRKSVANTWKFTKLHLNQPKERLRQFLVDLLSCPFEQNYRGIFPKPPEKYSATLELSHLYSMVGILANLATRTNVDVQHNLHYFAEPASLSSGWGGFVARSCQSDFTDQMAVPPNKHDSSEWELYSSIKSIWKNNSDTALSKALCAIHLIDYACWRDLPGGVPKICLELYASYEERGLLL